MKIRNISGVDLIAPWLGGRMVLADQVVDVPADGYDGVTAYTQVTGRWAPEDDDARAAHNSMLADIAEIVGEDLAAATEMKAGDLVKTIADMSAEEIAVVLVAEQDRAKPRTTVLAAAEKRLAEINDPIDPDPSTAPGDDTTTED